MREHARLARARAREHEYGGDGRGNGGALRHVQALEEVVVGHGRARMIRGKKGTEDFSDAREKGTYLFSEKRRRTCFSAAPIGTVRRSHGTRTQKNRLAGIPD